MLAQKFVFKLLNLKKSSSLVLTLCLILASFTQVAESVYTPLTQDELTKLALFMANRTHRAYIIASPVRKLAPLDFPIDGPEIQRPISPEKKGNGKDDSDELFFMSTASERYHQSGVPVYVVGPKIQENE